MVVGALWAALHAPRDGQQRPPSVGVTASVLNLSRTVAYVTGYLSFTPGTLDELTAHPEPDVLRGPTTWYFSDRRWAEGGVAFDPAHAPFPFNPHETAAATLVFTRRRLVVQATVAFEWGSTTFTVEDRAGMYVGTTAAIGGTEPHLYAFAFSSI
jgi:hypothetical protein